MLSKKGEKRGKSLSMLPVTFDTTNLSLAERFEVDFALVDDAGVMSVFYMILS
jgi:hypothetical protein